MIKEDEKKKREEYTDFVSLVQEVSNSNNIGFDDKEDSNTSRAEFKDIVNSINPINSYNKNSGYVENDTNINLGNVKNNIISENTKIKDYDKSGDKNTDVINNKSITPETKRINGQKSKEEISQQVINSKKQSVSLNQATNNSIIDKDVKIGLANEKNTQNVKEVSIDDLKAMKQANKKNENIEKGGVEAFNEWADTTLNGIFGGVKKAAAGFANVATTLIGLGVRGLAGASKIAGLENAGNALDNAYNSIIDFGSETNEIANYEANVRTQTDNSFTRTSGDITDIISNMVGNQLIGYGIGINGTVAQGLSVGGSSAQEVLDKNKDNITQATLTGTFKGFTSYLTEKMFDANILTKGGKKTSIQKGVDRLISNTINSKFGREFANKLVGIVGENLEELVEDNAGYLIDKLINNEELPGFEQWWKNTTETAKMTTLSTMVMGLIGLGGESFHDKEMDMETEYWVEQAQQIIEQEDLAIHFNPNEVKHLNETEPFYITHFTQDGELANIVPTEGKPIYNPKQELDVTPVVVRDSATNYYNIIDGNTGVILDNTYYETTMEAEGGFYEKANNLTELQVKDINNKINEANYLFTNEIIDMVSQAQEQLFSNEYQNVNQETNTNNETYTEQTKSKIATAIEQVSDKSIYNNTATINLFNTVSNNVDNIKVVKQGKDNYVISLDKDGHVTYHQKLSSPIYTGAKIKQIANTAIQNADTNNNIDNTKTNVIQKPQEPKSSNFYSNETNYAVQDVKKVTEPFEAKQEYTIDEMAEIWNNEITENEYDVVYDNNGNIKNYIAIEEDGGNLVVNQYDSEDNIVKSEVIPDHKGKYTSKAIKDTIEKVSSLYDENKPIKGQQDIEGNEVRNMKKANKTDEQIRNIVKYNQDGREITDSNYIDFMVERYKDNINISNVETDTNYIESISNKTKKEKINDLYSKIKDKEFKTTKKLYNESKHLETRQIDLLITKSGLNESFNKGLSDEKYAIVPFLDEIIKTSQDGIIRNETKQRENIDEWYYLYNTAKINNELYGIKIDIKKTGQGDRFYVHRVNLINKKGNSNLSRTPLEMEKSTNRFPITNTSIPQKTKTVKNDTTINKQSTQENKNNTNISNENIRSMKKNNLNNINGNIQTDNQGRKLSKEQQEYFKNSKVRDKEGNLLVVYHGTNNAGFTKFKRNVNYFSDSKEVAQTYTGNAGIYEGYINIENPIVIDVNKEIWSKIDIGDISINTIEDIESFLNTYGASTWKEDGKVRTSTADLVSAISDAIDENVLKADGIIIKNIYDEGAYSGSVGAKLGNDYITFKSNQFKNNTNEKPTIDDDIRYMKKSNTTSSNTKKNNTLIAQHNTSEEKILEALELGALPVPSIAVTKYQNPVSNYGDITLLFNKDTINPTDKRNVTYNSDIYSTRKPQTANVLDKQKVKSFEKVATDNGISYGYLNMIEEYIENNDLIKARDTIKYELQKSNENITDQEIENVYTEALKCIQEKRIMKPGVDPYTPSGNRKTIQQMSVPYTLDNIVQIMTKKNTKGSESNTFAGLAEVRANLSQKFKSIEAMHNSENNLISAQEMEKLKVELNDTFYNLLDEIGKYDSVDRYWGSGDIIANAINETAKSKNITVDVLDNELDYVSIKNVPQNVLQKTVDFLNDLKDVPTEYFEAKPQRAVGFDEVQKAIVPVNTSKEVIDRLTGKGIKIEYYKTQDERMKKISNTENIRFAKRTAKSQNNEVDKTQRNAERQGSYIEQEIQKIEATGNWDNSIPVTKLTDIRKTIEDYLGIGIKKGHFRQAAYAIYKGNRDVIRTKEFKDMDSILHETGHALDIGNRLKVDKESIANELLTAIDKLGGYEEETREIRLEEGFAEVIREYSIVPEQAKAEYPQAVSVIESMRKADKSFDKFIGKVQEQTYNYIHQNPENRVLSNQSIGEQTDKTPLSKEWIKQVAIEHMFDKDYVVKSSVETLQKINGKTVNQLNASKNAYYMTRLANATGDKAISMLTDGYIDEKGNKIMPGLNQIGEIFEQETMNMGLKGKEKSQAVEQRFNDLRAYLVARRDTDYKSKSLKTGIRSMDSKAVIEQFENDTQIQQAAKTVYDTLDGMLQYSIDNGLLSQEEAKALKESNAFYVPMQRVLDNRGNQVGRKGAVTDIIKKRTGSELDVKDVLENIIANSVNIVQQVENNNALKALYNQGQESGITGVIYDVIDTPMVKIGTANLNTWKTELKKQGVDVSKLDLEKTIDLFAPNKKVDTKNRITSFINDDGKRIYLQFNDDVLFASMMGLDTESTSNFLNIVNKLNTPLRYGATMANIGFAIPNMISDTAQAAIFSTAGFIPVVDNALGVLDVLTATNKTVSNFMNKVAPEYAERINYMYTLYQQSGASSGTRIAQERKSVQSLMSGVYGSENLGIQDKFKPLKRLLDLMTYIPEISEQSTRFEVFKKNYNYYKGKGNAEMDARVMAALESRDATQDFSRMGKTSREINKLIPFSAARIGSSYTFAEKIKANPKQVATRIAVLSAIAIAIRGLAGDDEEIEELNQRKKDDNFVLKVGDNIVTIKKPQGILRSMVNLTEYIYDLVTGHIEEGKEGERLVSWLQNAIMDNMPADDVTGLVPSAITPIIENAINYDLYYHTDIVKSYDLELPDEQQYYDYNSQLAIWLGQIFNYSPAKIDNAISGYFGGLGTQVTGAIDTILGKTGMTVEKPDMGAESNAVGKRFIVNVNSNSASIDEIYNLKTELTKKKNGGTITDEESKQLETINSAISNMSNLNKQIKGIKKDLSLSGKEKAEQIKLLQQERTDTARQALGKNIIHSENKSKIQNTQFYPGDTLKKSGYTLTLNAEQKKEYAQIANEYYSKYESQGLYNEEKLKDIKSKAKEYAKGKLMQKYKSDLVKTKK